MTADLAARGDDGFRQTRRVLGLLDSLRIGLAVNELERVSGNQIDIENAVAAVVFQIHVIQQQRQPGARVNAEVALALGADVEILVEIFLPDDLAAAIALHPQAFGADFFLAASLDLGTFALEPGHNCSG